MAVSIAWVLSKLRFPLIPELGGVSPGYLDGLNWRCINTINQVVIDTGAAWCPYAGAGRIVQVTSPITITVPVGTGFSRVNLWLHADSGVATVVADDNAALTDNYYGNAYQHPVNKGWRYLGSLIRNSAGNLFSQSCEGDDVYFNSHTAQAPFEFLNTAGQSATRTVNMNGLLPASAITIKGIWTTTTQTLRLAPSTTTTAGNQLVGSTWFVYAVGVGVSPLEIYLGRDQTFQYANDAAGGAVVARSVGYRFRR